MVERSRLLAAATVTLCAGCAGGTLEGLTVTRCGELGPVDKLTVTVVGPQRTLLFEQPFPEDGRPPQLPGRLRVDAGGHRGAVRVLVTAWQGVSAVAFGVTRLELAAGATGSLCLGAPFPADRDGDAIPDSEDRCPQIPDAQQQDSDGDGVSDICALLNDAGFPADASPDAGAVDAASDGAVRPECVPGDACDDGEPCTDGDLCALDGVCRGFPVADSTSCGPEPGRRCCAGRCVAIWSDPNHCGGCGLRCATGYACQGVAWTGQCSASPQVTSGRCLCADFDSSLCPAGQTCRYESPVSNRCNPKDRAHCASSGKVKWLTDCPNYCYYD